ncbi:hypothetical protein DPMN_072404 [Dreissena polymorpha]|uniref:Uncharacterized protein n=1 Tax=Dreissena polymorpha TaxID=45954 RepID=A0A9D4BQF4_DREPO|nr:hypothetical protein DPMN_072404 [Dreissena polymorpha]
MPVNELVRLVGVYSTPWEEKSAALKKLHEDYEVKQRQLHIAIKRLQLVDAHVSFFHRLWLANFDHTIHVLRKLGIMHVC